MCATSKVLAISCLLLTGRPALLSSTRYSATATSKAGYMPDLDEGIILLFEAPFVLFFQFLFLSQPIPYKLSVQTEVLGGGMTIRPICMVPLDDS